MTLIASHPVAATPESIAEGARILARGGLVAFPTETVYGLGADATNGEAVAAIFAAKGRPRFNPLIVHVADGEASHGVMPYFPRRAHKLARAFWPGALTLVLPRRCRQPPFAFGQRGSRHGGAARAIASGGARADQGRWPAHRRAQRQSFRPVSATTAAHVAEGLGDQVELILDGGATPLGLESTVIGFDGESPVLLRPGAIAREKIEAVIGPLAAAGRQHPIAGPTGKPLCAARRVCG